MGRSGRKTGGKEAMGRMRVEMGSVDRRREKKRERERGEGERERGGERERERERKERERREREEREREIKEREKRENSETRQLSLLGGDGFDYRGVDTSVVNMSLTSVSALSLPVSNLSP